MKPKKFRKTLYMVDCSNVPSGETFRELTLPGGQTVHIMNREIFQSAIHAADEKLRELLREDRAARRK
jgi:hypothetical protein